MAWTGCLVAPEQTEFLAADILISFMGVMEMISYGGTATKPDFTITII